jgi:hypothetical protein
MIVSWTAGHGGWGTVEMHVENAFIIVNMTAGEGEDVDWGPGDLNAFMIVERTYTIGVNGQGRRSRRYQRPHECIQDYQ